MDVSEITKVATRKRLNADAEKLREKVSRETAKIIKLKVAQDTAYWDLKEKLQQVEGNHERLQQNMVEVQMQHEAISGQYQDELRLRPDTLNKLSSTREICDVLEEYSERLKDTLTRCKNDQASLCDAYQKSGNIVFKMKQDYEKMEDGNKQLIRSLKDKLADINAHHVEYKQIQYESQEMIKAELALTKKSLSETLKEKETLAATAIVTVQKLEQYEKETQMREQKIGQMEFEVKKMTQDMVLEVKALRNTLKLRTNELEEAAGVIKKLSDEIDNLNSVTSELRSDNTLLKQDLCILKEELENTSKEHAQLTCDVKSANDENEHMKLTVANLTALKGQLETDLIEKNKALQETIIELDELKSKLIDLERVKTDLNLKLEEAYSNCQNHASNITELEATCRLMEQNNAEVEAAFKTHREESEAKILDLKRIIEENEKQLNVKASTIGQLMCEVGTAGETAARLETALQNLKKESDLQRQAAMERDSQLSRQLEHAQIQVAEKEIELSKQMTIILEMKSEKERLQEKIQSMQNKIDNIQKELSGPQPRPPAGDAPEQDDNAVAFAPTPIGRHRDNTKTLNAMCSPPLKPPKKHKHSDIGKHDNMLFSIFSDTSLDGDSNMIDSREVNRRFEALARGEPVAPVSINTLKRRKAPSGGLRTIDEEDMSLSQVKKKIKNDEPKKFFKNVRPINKK